MEAIAAQGFAFATDTYDKMRYIELAESFFARLAERQPTTSFGERIAEEGFATPKMDVRGASLPHEHLLVGLRDRSKVRTFGAPTAGVSTVIDEFPLPDGSMLWLATGIAVGSDGRTYPRRIEADEPLQFPVDSGRDPVRTAAEEWLNNHPACDR